MSLFDTIHYKGKDYQTKDTPMQCLEAYDIRDDELWFKNVKRIWIEDETRMFGGYFAPLSETWEPVLDFDGSIEFYNDNERFIALFWDGKMIKIKNSSS